MADSHLQYRWLGILLLLSCPALLAAPPGGGMPPPEVTVHQVVTRDLTLSTELTGRTTAHLVAEVRPRVNGIVEERLFNEGGDIEAGALLYRLDDALYQAAYDSASAALKRDEASLNTARMKAKRYQSLLKSKTVSQENYDDAQAALAEARADVEVSRAALRGAEINLNFTRITAPIAGRVGRSQVTVGALVTANQGQPLVTIQQIDPIYVDLSQSSSALLQLQRAIASGQLQAAEQLATEVQLILQDGSRYAHKGTLQFTEAQVDAATGTVTLRALFPNPERELLPGMYVRAEVGEGVRHDAILIPQRAVNHDSTGHATAMVVNAESKVELRRLKLGRSVDNQWLVLEGLTPGERVIVEGGIKVRPGSEVRIAQPAAAKPR